MIQPPCSCLTSLHVGVHSGSPLSHISQLTCALLSTTLMPARSRAHVTPARVLLCLTLARPLASCSRAHSTIVLRVVAYAVHAHCCAHCPALLAPMPQRALFCRAPANSPTPPYFRAHHKHAHLLPWLVTRPPSQATAIGLHDSRW